MDQTDQTDQTDLDARFEFSVVETRLGKDRKNYIFRAAYRRKNTKLEFAWIAGKDLRYLPRALWAGNRNKKLLGVRIRKEVDVWLSTG